MWGILTLLTGAFAMMFPQQAKASFGRVATVSQRVFGPFLPEPDPFDLDTLARTAWGEARGEGERGMQAVVNVVMNRYRLAKSSLAYARQFGETPAEICRKKYQFSVWLINDPNFAKMQSVTTSDPAFATAVSLARRGLQGILPDITSGADHYHTTAINPKWAKGQIAVAQIGTHKFYQLA